MLSLSVFNSPSGSGGKESACNAGDLDSIPESGRSPGEGHGNPLQYFCLENPMDRGAWGGLQSMGLQRAGHNGAATTLLSGFGIRVMVALQNEFGSVPSSEVFLKEFQMDRH